MKKTNFLSGLAAVVLGCMFTSCEKEDLTVTHEPGPAKVTINVTVIDALTKKDVTNEATITVVEKEKAEFNEAINAEKEFPKGVEKTTITIKATLGENGEATAKVEIKGTKVGGVATYPVVLTIADGLKIAQTTIKSETSSVYAEFDGVNHDASHSHKGITGWYVNASDYIQVYKVTYPVKVEYTGFSDLVKGDIYNKLDKVQIEGINASYSNICKEEAKVVETKTTEIKVSAWAYFNALVETTTTEYKWTVQTINSSEIAATWTGKGISCTELKWGYDSDLEIAHPDHAGHYQHGHGHGINASNAGGGIVLPE